MTISEDPAERADRYIQLFELSLKKNQILSADCVVKAENIMRVSDAIQRYVKDAKHYLVNQKPTTSLVSISYAEGLLDALAYLELANPK